MGLNETPAGNRIHIAFFGKRNAGKSSILNAITNQNLAIVSDTKGTTTDPVYKAMELLPLGPVMLIDTPGIDDEGALGELRIKKAQQVLNKTDIAVLVMDAKEGESSEDEALIQLFQKKEIPYLLVFNKCDLLQYNKNPKEHSIFVSAKTGEQIYTLKEKLSKLIATDNPKIRLVGDILDPCDYAILVMPIDKAAPKGRLILPQQQTIRDILDANAISIVVKETEFAETLRNLGRKPRIVITDSQVFHKINAETPEDIFLTSFSILMARYKGVLKTAVNGAKTLDFLEDGDKILISEGCTHHRQCDDIGTVKLPQWIKSYTNKNVKFEFTSGNEFPDNLTSYQLVVHCGGCMLNEKEMKYRQRFAAESNIPFTNYGILIAFMQGILQRSISVFPEFLSEMKPPS